MYLHCIVNEKPAILLGFVAVGPNNQPHAVVQIEDELRSVPISEVIMPQAEAEKVAKSTKKVIQRPV